MFVVPYRSDVFDARWALIEPVFSAWRARRTGWGTAARVHDLREIVNAILYVNRTGIPCHPVTITDRDLLLVTMPINENPRS